MSVLEKDTIDIVSISTETNELVLTITDHLEWDFPQHLELLQEKLNTYFQYIESGQADQDRPQSKFVGYRIDIACKFEPGEAALSFIAEATRIAADAYIAVSYQVAKT